MKELLNLDKLPEAVARKVRPYLEKMIEIQKENLLSAAVYGSASGEEYSEKSSDINLLLICESVDLPVLKKSLRLIREGIRDRIPAPLFLTRFYIETSSDVFPVEFLEMKENHRLLYGEDFLSGIEVNIKNLRHQCEEQVKGKLVRIRQAYLEIGLEKGGVESLLKRSLSSLMPIFRNVLRLRGEEPPRRKEEILKKVAASFDLEEGVFLAIRQDRRDDEKIEGEDVEVYLEKYLIQLVKLARAIDAI